MLSKANGTFACSVKSRSSLVVQELVHWHIRKTLVWIVHMYWDVPDYHGVSWSSPWHRALPKHWWYPVSKQPQHATLFEINITRILAVIDPVCKRKTVFESCIRIVGVNELELYPRSALSECGRPPADQWHNAKKLIHRSLRKTAKILSIKKV